MIKNLRNRTVISADERYLKDPFSQMIGLMFSRKKKDFCVVFLFKRTERLVIYMFLVFYAIDVILLDEQKKVVEILKDFKPFACHRAEQKAQFVVELPSGSIERKDIRIGDRLSFP